MEASTAEELIARADALHRSIGAHQLELLRVIARLDDGDGWRGSGARDLNHWISMRYGVSHWKAERWVAAARALRGLPRISEALARGELSIDKAVELTRFATPGEEATLIRWARAVSSGAIRHRGDLLRRRSVEEAREVESSRRLGWWYEDEGRRFRLEALLPAADGAAVARALDRQARCIPVLPGEEDSSSREARRADALVAVCSAWIARDPDPDRATVVIHAPLEALLGGDRGCEADADGVIHPETARRLLCTSRLQVVLEDPGENPVGVGRMSREPPDWLLRLLRRRDSFQCTFPSCGTRAYTQAHHIRRWNLGGPTDLDNLILTCSFHHKLVHEHGWTVRRHPDGIAAWFRPDGTRHRAGPAPPARWEEPQPA